MATTPGLMELILWITPIYRDICAVSYRLGYQDPLNSASSDLRTLGLYRTVMDAETTFSEALDLSAKGESYYREFWLQWSSQTTREEYLIIYNLIDSHPDYFTAPVRENSRSWMNIVFRLSSEELEQKFISEAKTEGLIGLKGHRSVGGIRVSLYNAMTLEGAEKVAEFMENFRRNN